MAYRKIHLNGVTYEYTVGRTHVKIKNIGAVRKDEIGRLVIAEEHGYFQENPRKNIEVSPADIVRFIQSHQVQTTKQEFGPPLSK